MQLHSYGLLYNPTRTSVRPRRFARAGFAPLLRGAASHLVLARLPDSTTRARRGRNPQYRAATKTKGPARPAGPPSEDPVPRRPGPPRGNKNALTHGLTATASLHLLPGENLDDLAALWRASATLATVPITGYLVSRFAGIIWRLQRIPALEVTALARLTPPAGQASAAADDIDAVLNDLLGQSNSPLDLDLLMRYETHLQRCLLSTLAALHAIRQLGESTCPAPSATTDTPNPETSASQGTP